MRSEIRVSRIIDAAAGDIYQAFIDPIQYVIWGPTRFENDPVVGGKFHQETDIGGNTYVILGDYSNLVPDRLIAMNWNFLKKGSNEISQLEVRIEITPEVEGGTRITATETGASITSTEPGDDLHEAWEQVFSALDTFLQERVVDSHTMTRHLAAAPKRIFAAWTTPSDLEIWLANIVEVDARLGGSYSLTSSAPEGDHVCSGEYLEFEPGRRLVKSWYYRGPEVPNPEGATRVEVTLAPVGDGITGMRFVESGTGLGTAAERRESSEAWNNAFATLKEVVEK